MPVNNRELWLAGLGIAIITAFYLAVVASLKSIPPARELFGHSIGIIGFILMLMTETLYSLRKRSRSARWGRMSEWLSFHIFTGIVGPYMVLLHSAWKFNGLAGISMLLTVVIVASGFVGRYIYTSVPRTVDGAEIEESQLKEQAEVVQTNLHAWIKANPERAQLLAPLLVRPSIAAGGASAFFSHPYEDFRQGLRWRAAHRQMDQEGRAQLEKLEKLAKRQDILQRQVASLKASRRLLSLWHNIHIPIGMALFTTAFIHIFAAIYYATLLR